MLSNNLISEPLVAATQLPGSPEDTIHSHVAAFDAIMKVKQHAFPPYPIQANFVLHGASGERWSRNVLGTDHPRMLNQTIDGSVGRQNFL